MTAILLLLAAVAGPQDDGLSPEARRDVARLTARLNADIKRANARNDDEASAAAGRLLTGIQQSVAGGYVGTAIPIVGKYRCFSDANWVFEFDQYGSHRETFKGGGSDWTFVASGEGWAEYKHPSPKNRGLVRSFQAVSMHTVIVRDYVNGTPDRSFVITKGDN